MEILYSGGLLLILLTPCQEHQVSSLKSVMVENLYHRNGKWYKLRLPCLLHTPTPPKLSVKYLPLQEFPSNSDKISCSRNDKQLRALWSKILGAETSLPAHQAVVIAVMMTAIYPGMEELPWLPRWVTLTGSCFQSLSKISLTDFWPRWRHK